MGTFIPLPNFGKEVRHLRLHIAKLGQDEYQVRIDRTRKSENRSRQAIVRGKAAAKAAIARLVHEMRGEQAP